jgi:hypothetical protein
MCRLTLRLTAVMVSAAYLVAALFALWIWSSQ